MPDPSRTEVQLCHPNPVILRGLHAVLAQEPDIEVLASADPRPQRLPGATARRRVVVASHRQALAWLREPAAAGSGLRVLVVDEASRGWVIRSALQSGALGYVAVDGPLQELVPAGAAWRAAAASCAPRLRSPWPTASQSASSPRASWTCCACWAWGWTTSRSRASSTSRSAP